MIKKLNWLFFDLDNTLFFNKLWIKANKDTFETYMFKDIDYSDFMKLFKNMIYTFGNSMMKGLLP